MISRSYMTPTSPFLKLLVSVLVFKSCLQNREFASPAPFLFPNPNHYFRLPGRGATWAVSAKTPASGTVNPDDNG